MIKRIQFIHACACALALGGVAPAAAQLDRAVDQAEQATQSAQTSQERINRIDDARGDIFAEYRATLQRIESRSLYVEQQRVFLQSQRNEIDDLRRQIDQVDEITSELYPMQFEMIDALEQFILLDVPFQLDERLRRVREARELMDAHDVAPAEKYRKIIEAYELEVEYGRFVEAWEGQLSPEPDAPVVDFVRYGRVAWVYMTKDGGRLGIWNTQTNDWDPLSSSFLPDVRFAKRIADELASADLYRAPIPGPTDASSSAN